jgi:hypothetical protein
LVWSEGFDGVSQTGQPVALNTRLSLYAQIIYAGCSMVVLGTSVERTFNGMTVFRS